MTRRAVWLAVFLPLVAATVGMELWAAFDHSADTVPLTDVVVAHVPQAVTTLAVDALVAWLPAHFATRYRQEVPMGRYAKAIVAVLAAALTAAQATLPMSDQWHSIVAIGLTVLGAAGVYAVPNTPPRADGEVRPLPGPRS